MFSFPLRESTFFNLSWNRQKSSFLKVSDKTIYSDSEKEVKERFCAVTKWQHHIEQIPIYWKLEVHAIPKKKLIICKNIISFFNFRRRSLRWVTKWREQISSGPTKKSRTPNEESKFWVRQFKNYFNSVSNRHFLMMPFKILRHIWWASTNFKTFLILNFDVI